MNRICAALFCAVLLCMNGSACAEVLQPGPEREFSAKIIAVLDGDTVLIRRANGLVKIRLAEIDAPEVGHAGMGGQPPNSQKAQAFGVTSKKSLSDMVLGKQVKVISQTVDQYNRLVAHLNVNGLDVNAEQIRRGMAWEYSNYHSNKALIALQNEAKQAPRGLWVQSNPIPPWEWRLRHVTDKTTSHSTRRANNTRQVAGYGEASRLRELPPAAHSANEEQQPVELGRRKQHPSTFSSKPNTAVSSDATPANTTSHNPGCGDKRRCSEMSSCEEAKYYFAQCGVKSLDGDGDGVPCEKLCVSIAR